VKSIAVNNAKVDIKSKTPMPYDPANFSVGYSYSESQRTRPDAEYETSKDYRANFSYSYTPYATPFRPFAKLVKKETGATRYAKQFAINYLPANIGFQTTMMRNYSEMQMRNLDNPDPENKKDLLSFSQNFLWDRAFTLNWNFTTNLKVTFSSGTNARIEEPHIQVNKALNPDQYQVWKDSVMQSIADLGTPLKYDQQTNVTYTLPLQHIPILDWVNASGSYNASYNWERGATVEEDVEIGNSIRNQRQVDLQGSFNFQALYNKNKFLKGIIDKASSRSATAAVQNSKNNQNKDKEIKKVEKSVQLNPDSGTVVQHGMLTKRVIVTARKADGRRYPIKFKPLDPSRIRIENKDTALVNLTIVPTPPLTDIFFYQTAEHTLRLLMTIRRFDVKFSQTAGMMIPGYRPAVGDFFGQGQTSSGLAPGLAFAFGDIRRSYVDELSEKDWLVMNQTNINPAVINNATNLTVNMNLEPLPGLKIDLNANRVDTWRTEIQYMYKGMPEVPGGNFTMTTVAIGTILGGTGDAGNNYASEAFDRFIRYRDVITRRMESRYAQTKYPNAGFLTGSSLAGQSYNPAIENGAVNPNSSDVLIPAFLAAYTGQDANRIALTPFPSLASLLPNWRISYDGLLRIPLVKKYFKSLLLNHQYRCTYSVGSFTSFLNWVDAGKDGLGYIQDILTNNPTPSSPYSISAVSITDAFSPLIGVDGTLLNNITLRADYTKTRNLNLNISSYQLVESLSEKTTIGVGYKFAEFNKILGIRGTQNYNNDLTLRLDLSHNKMLSLIRKFQEGMTQATSGNVAQSVQFSADYGLSRALTLRAFYELQVNKPLISSAAYPTSNANYGISLRFSLTR
jgi:cell surface protein SprA